MKLLFLGDVMGRTGRSAIADNLPRLRREWALDFVVVNGENATAGMGLSAEHAQGILKAGADVITLGDHAFDQKDMLSFIDSEPRLIRPVNFAKKAPGRGFGLAIRAAERRGCGVDAFFAKYEGKAPGQKKKEVGEGVPFGRMGTAQDLTGMAIFLASDEADYIVSQTYNVDGGQWMS